MLPSCHTSTKRVLAHTYRCVSRFWSRCKPPTVPEEHFPPNNAVYSNKWLEGSHCTCALMYEILGRRHAPVD